jgi:hypothetical protein
MGYPKWMVCKGKSIVSMIWGYPYFRKPPFGDGSKPWYLVNIKIAGKWMFIPLKMVIMYRY